MTSEWKTIPSFPMYEASTDGLIRSKARERVTPTGGLYVTPAKVLTQFLQINGYKHVALYRDGVRKNVLVHRVVAMAFLGVGSESLQVDHINGNKHDNRPENLRWCTAKGNINNPVTLQKKIGPNNHFYGKKHSKSSIEKMKRSIAKLDKSGANNPSARKLVNITTGVIFSTVRKAAKSIGVSECSIPNAIRRGSCFCKGFQWRYA